jgi:ABC-type dipeptide/oligopeptide/nickel transport system permease subunit
MNQLAEPGGQYLLGADQYGRDILSRLLYARAIR